MSAFWDERTVVGEVARDERNKIIVSRTKWQDKQYIDIRNWYRYRADEHIWLPGKGISVPVDQFAQVMAVLSQVEHTEESVG